MTEIRSPLTLKIITMGKTDPTANRDLFVSAGGDTLLKELLEAASLDSGLWEFRTTGKFSGSAGTPPIQVRKATHHGVEIWFKPGDNGTATKGVLFVTRDRGRSPAQVLLALKDANFRLYPPRPRLAPKEDRQEEVPLVFTEGEARRLLSAVHECCMQDPGPSMEVFMEEVEGKLGDHGDSHFWTDLAEKLVERGWLKDARVRYTLTDRGSEAMVMVAPPNGQTGITTTPSGNGRVKEVGDLLLKSRERLLKLQMVADGISESRSKQQSLQAEIDRLEGELAFYREELASEQNIESGLTCTLPVAALTRLDEDLPTIEAGAGV